ncbi:MAG: hypothetical protein Q9180_005374 [Flavoplaca navasiana]
MAGLDIVGVVLASLPLVVSAIEHYRDALNPLQDYSEYDRALKLLRIFLLIEQDLFESTLKLLLLDSLTPDQARNLFPDQAWNLGSDQIQNVDIVLWRTDEIDKKLKMRLGSKYTVFMGMVGEMEAVMKILMKDLEVEVFILCQKSAEDAGARCTDYRCQPNWQGTSELIMSSIKKGKREWRKVKWSFGRKRREALLQRFRKCNRTIALYVEQREILAPTPILRSNEMAQYFHKVRDDASKVYEALENGWNCRRSCSHSANLQLEARDSSTTAPEFKVALSSPIQNARSRPELQWVNTHVSVAETSVQTLRDSKDWEPKTEQSADRAAEAHTTKLRSSTRSSSSQTNTKRNRRTTKPEILPQVMGTPSNLRESAPYTEYCPKLIPIGSLCEALQSPQSTPAILGCLASASLDQRIAIATTSSTLSYYDKPLSLNNLVAARKPSMQPHESFGNLSGRQRLTLAVTLAHTVLQLHNSPWLNESWSKDDIWFFASAVSHKNRIDLERAYIFRSFNPQSDQSIANAGKAPIIEPDRYSHLIINKSLFALGVVLIELALKRSFEDLCSEAMNSEPAMSERSYNTAESFQVATSLIDLVYDEQGTQYGYVVQRCLRCEFGFQDSKKRLEVDAFRAAVYEGVIAPLEEDLRRYALPEN